MAMVAMHAKSVLGALREDLDSAWSPDPLGGVDFEAIARDGQGPSGDVAELTFPRPVSRPMQVFVIPFEYHLRLHLSVQGIKETADATLLPTVCGYRRGAEADQPYQREHGRFMEHVAAGAEDHGIVLKADVSSFFASLSSETVLMALGEICGNSATLPIKETLEELEVAGVRGLPPGYADARLLANLVLHRVDMSLRSPFARWVDDYRIFVDDEGEAQHVLSEMDAELKSLGLSLNREKVRLFDARRDQREFLARPLESVYHPDREAPETSKRELRRLLTEALADPVACRRELRFSIRRLGELRDPFAVQFAVGLLDALPWELPRLVGYLGHFLEERQVYEAVSKAAQRAIGLGDLWSYIRLAPLLARLPSTMLPLDSLLQFVASTGNSAAWGLGLRVISATGRREDIRDLTRTRGPDARAALAASLEVGVPPPEWAAKLAPTTLSVLESRPAPQPSFGSIL